MLDGRGSRPSVVDIGIKMRRTPPHKRESREECGPGGSYKSLVSGLDPQDFAWVHQVVGVERLFDGAHDADRLAMLGDQEIHLAIADSVLARACTLQGQGAADQALVETFH